jgi:hypothetical protein
MRLYVFLVILHCIAWSQQAPEWQEVDSDDDSEEIEVQWQESSTTIFQLNLVELNQSELYTLADSSVWEKIIQHRLNTGYYFSEYEIQSISGIDATVVKRLLPHLRADIVPGELKKNLKESDLHYLMVRKTIGAQGGFSGRYRRSLRSAHHTALRFSENRGNWKFSGNAWLQVNRKFRLLIGHYKTDWGLGLLLGMYSPGKNAEPILSVWHSSAEDIPWNSSGIHFRGAVGRYEWKKRWICRTGYSDKRDPAVVRDSILRYWVWVPTSSSKWVREQTLFSSLQWRSTKSEWGMLIMAQQTSFPQLDWGNKSFRPAGSLYFRKKSGEKSVAVEAAITDQKPAVSASLLCPLSAKLEMAMNARHVSTGYYSKYMNTFGLKYQTPKVSALYSALRYLPSRRLSFALNVDHFQYEMEKKRNAFTLREMGVFGQMRFSKSHQVFVKVRYKHSPEDGNQNQWNWQIQQSTESLPFRLKTRFQGAMNGTQKALVAGGEIEYKKPKLSFLVGVSIYQIEHYTLKQSWYERNLYLSSGFTWFYNEGQNRYALVGWSPVKDVKIWLRGFYGSSRSGVWHELSFQLVYKLND